MKLTGAQTVAVADFADGESVTIDNLIDKKGCIVVRRSDNNETQSISIDADGTIIASSGFDWKKLLGKNKTPIS